MHCLFFEHPFIFEHSLNYLLFSVAKKEYSQHKRGSPLMHIHRLTDNNKVVSLEKIINFEVPKFENYPCFSKHLKYSLRQPSSATPDPPSQHTHPPTHRRTPPVSFGPPPLWIAPPR